MREVLDLLAKAMPHIFQTPPQASNIDQKKELYERIKRGKEPSTKEGIVLWDPNGSKPAIKVKFKPEFAGKLNFYVSAIDDLIKSDKDNPTIGILICKSKNNTVVEYALKDINKPIGVSEYIITKNLPEEFKSSLPSIEEIEAELNQTEI